MRRIAMIAGWGCFALAAMVLAGWGCSRMLAPPTQQRDALALLERPWHPAGSNAFDALWLLGYDVPEAELAVVTDADAARLSAQPHAALRGTGEAIAFTSGAQGRHASLRMRAEDTERLCRPRGDDCLAKVRADVGAYRGIVVRNGRLLARVRALSRHGHVRNRLPPGIDAPLPDFNLLRLGLTADATRFADGDIDGALASTCTAISTWRRLGRATDALIAQMISIAYGSDGHGRLLADMLRELPRDHVVPEACRVALAPPLPQEASLCQAMRGEFAMLVTTMRALETADEPTGTALGNLLVPLAFDAEATILEAAPHYARLCEGAAAERVARDEAFRAPAAAGDRELLRLDCIANAVGCVLAEMARPDMSAYQNRALDHNARLRVLVTALWLQEDASTTGTLATRLAARPQALRWPGREVEAGPRGDTLRIRQYDISGGRPGYWEIALSPAVIGAGPGDATPSR